MSLPDIRLRRWARGWDQPLKIPLKIITSGVEFPNLEPDQAKLLEQAFSEFMISLDSAEQGEHDKLRGRPGLYEWIVNYVRNRKLREKTILINVPAADLVNACALHRPDGFNLRLRST